MAISAAFAKSKALAILNYSMIVMLILVVLMLQKVEVMFGNIS